MFRSPPSSNGSHQQQPPQSQRRLVKPNSSFISSNHVNNVKTKKQAFVSRLRCILLLLVITMTSSVLFMFQMAKSSEFFSSKHPHNNDTPLAVAKRGYSIYKRKHLASHEDKKQTRLHDIQKRNNEQQAKQQQEHQQWQDQHEADKHYSKYKHKAAENQKEATKKLQLDKQQEPEPVKARSHENNPQKPDSKAHETKNDLHDDTANHKGKHNNKVDHDQTLQKPIDSPKNIFHGRKGSDHSDNNNNNNALPDENTLASPVAKNTEKERALKQKNQQSEPKDSEAKQDDKQHTQPENPSMLKDETRGGAAAKSALKAVVQGVVIHNHNNNDDNKQPDGKQQKKSEKVVLLKPSEQDHLHSTYKHAVAALRLAKLRDKTDPLKVARVDTPIHKLHRVPFEPMVPIGVLVDAGRHYFSMSWWKRLIVYLYQLRFTLIQFRLTDDQTFNLQLESYPQLANPVLLKYNKQRKTYTAKDIRELVQFARGYNITLFPEINLPGHAGGWAGIPGLVVMCSEFICDKGYGLPLNIEHPNIKTILKTVLREVLDIFDNPPYLHLGGDEVNMADPCFTEVGLRPFNYSGFEKQLKGILQELRYPEEQVIRWERTGQSLSLDRAGAIEHFWESFPGVKSDVPKLPSGDARPWFVSKGLYFDNNHNDDGMAVYRNTHSALNYFKGAGRPKAIIAGTFELGEEYWRQRNVATRLIAVSMGASDTKFSGKMAEVMSFNQTCLGLGINDRWCNLQGSITVLDSEFIDDHQGTWKQWKEGICGRLTREGMKLELKSTASTRKSLETSGYNNFWSKFADDPLPTPSVPRRKRKESKSSPLGGEHSIPITGIIFDMVNSMRTPTSDILELLKKYVSPLGFNLVQLRLVNDFGFAIRLESQPKLGYTALQPKKGAPPVSIPTAQEYRELVTSAMNDLGIEIMPEVSFSTNAGGWLNSGFVAPCPNTLCDKGRGVANAVYESDMWAVVYSVLFELRHIFATSPYMHLGHDNRETARKGCFKEAAAKDPMEAFAEFEEKLTTLAFMVGIEADQIVRWNNEEDKVYSGRTGNITQYQTGKLKPSAGDKFFATVDLLSGSPWDIYKNTLALVKLKPMGILGQVGDNSNETWESMNIPLRLVAFSMGLQKKHKQWDHKSFQTHLVQHCKAYKFEGCDKPDGSKVKVSYEVEETRYSDRLCHTFTHNVVGREIRPEFLTS
ncbi:hexosaminidase subunit alpha [Seminavis robusta]|uniref:beta-N-acetylhexosaminidase n=1 Tax=Seminavis robusta TaxID=568900 RepID=A0A9N8HSI9_9STRA|nr:hexosaminidase subunit alpha [Seminavis robusta]|eukprot:Sro1528_g279980.1 hexosaminidase subunit alpha (1194) ;mRNA; r:13547-17128